MPRCTLRAAGPPVSAYSLTTSDAVTPSLALLDSGASSLANPAKVAMQAVVSSGSPSSIHWTTFAIAAPWPAGLVQGDGVATITDRTFSYAQMVQSRPSSSRLALMWLGEDAGPMGVGFRTIDADTMTMGPVVSHPGFGSTPLSMAAGFSPGGQGWNVVALQERFGGNPPETERAVLAILDDGGSVLFPSIPVFEPLPQPSSQPSVLWTGNTFRVATAFDECAPGDGMCAPRSVLVSNLQPGPSLRLEITSIHPGLRPDVVPRRPAMVRLDDTPFDTEIYVAWFERAPGEPESRATARLLLLERNGILELSETIVDSTAMPISSIDVTATDFGLIVHWFEKGDESLPFEAIGHSKLVAVRVEPHRALEGTVLAVEEKVEVGVSQYRARGRPSSVALAHPRSALLAWAGVGADPDRDAIHMVRLDCVPEAL